MTRRRGGSVLHVTNGDAAVPILRAAGLEGEILPWRDVLHDGPVPAVAAPELRKIRASFLSGQNWVEYHDALGQLETRDRALADAERLVLWFEHDLYDQLQLAQVLASSDAPAKLAQAETYLGEAPIGSLTPVEVTAAQRTAAREAWAAFRASDPRRLEAVAGDGLPFLRSALDRLLEEFPAVDRGLGRSELQAVEGVAEGAANRFEVFEASQAGEEVRFMGDASFFALLERLEPLVGRNPALHLTDLGERVLAGTADFVTARWIGGVEIEPPAPAWRWDAEHRCLVTMLAE